MSRTRNSSSSSVSLLTGMIATANRVFGPMSGANFTANTSSCSTGTGLIGTYTMNFLSVVNLTLTAKSCYPTVS